MGKVRVLLADDHAVVRAGIRNALQALPELDIVSEVDDGPSLMAALGETRPDLILFDVTMPDLQPVTAVREIRARYPAVKILVVSAYDDDIYVQGLLGAGVNGYHLKDQPLEDLKLAVQRVLAGERWIAGSLIDKLLGHAESGAPALSLTNRQREILRLLQQGLDNQTLSQQLGLSIKTVENHLTRLYRQLNVQSRLEAVRYIMEHPDVLDPAGGAPGVPAKPASQDGIIMLLVDDNPRYRVQLRRLVARVCPQARVYEAENTGDAMHQAERNMPQLVLVDVILGDEDGIRCARRIKAMQPESRVVLISAYPDREFRRLGMEAGAAAFVDKKDLDAATMRQMIDDVMA